MKAHRLILIAIVILSNVAHSAEWTGLTHHPLPSPDGKHVVSISERRYHPDKNDYSQTQSEYSLTLWTANPPPSYVLTAFSLTPRIRDVIVSPDGKVIAYLALDIHSWYGIYFYYPDSGEVVGIEYSSTGSVIKAIQLSTDLEYIRYYSEPDVDIDKPIYDADPNRPTKKSFKQLLVGAINGQWIAMALNPPGGYLFSKKEQDQIDWAPVQRPKEIPTFLTQPVPKIQKETQMQWSPDSKSLYLLDDQGIWRSDIGKQRYVYQWTQIVKKRAISRFQLSPTGTHLLYEVRVGQEIEHEIWIVNLQSDSANKIGKGWTATFSHDGNTLFYGNFKEYYEYNLDGTQAQFLGWVSWTPE